MNKHKRKKREAAKELAQSILIYMDVHLPKFVHPSQLARRFSASPTQPQWKRLSTVP